MYNFALIFDLLKEVEESSILKIYHRFYVERRKDVRSDTRVASRRRFARCASASGRDHGVGSVEHELGRADTSVLSLV